MSAEDAADDTLVPRLKAAGADLDRVGIVEGTPRDDGQGDRLFNLTRDLSRLELEIVRRGDVRLVCIDPVSAYLGGDADSHRDADVRGVLAPLSKLAEKHGVAVVLIMHQTKAVGVKTIYRAVGSIGFAAVARAVWCVAKDPQDDHRRLLLPVKMNLAPDSGGLAFRITDAGDGPSVCFEPGRVDVNPDELEHDGRKHRESPAKNNACEFLCEFLRDGPRPQADVEAEAKRRGIAVKTLRRAKDATRVRSRKVPDGWLWELPQASADDPRGQIGHDGHLGDDGQLGRVGQLEGKRPPQDGQDGQGGHENRGGEAGHVEQPGRPKPSTPRPRAAAEIDRADATSAMAQATASRRLEPPDQDEGEVFG